MSASAAKDNIIGEESQWAKIRGAALMEASARIVGGVLVTREQLQDVSYGHGYKRMEVHTSAPC
jgi:hypothetical protein